MTILHQPNARDIALALNLKQSCNTYTGACPCCGYASGFTVTEKHGKVLFYCHAGGCQADEILQTLKRYRLWGTDTSRHYGNVPVAKVENPSTLDPMVQKLWQTSQPASGTIVETYLNRRGITCSIPASIRLLAKCWHKPTDRNYPAMLAMVTPWQGSPVVALHRTYLKPDGSGKIDDPQAKMILGPVKGCSVHLAEPGSLLAVTEGIETALSVYQATGISTWAALSCGGIKNLILPPWPQAQEVIICADHDSPGLEAATHTAEQWVREGRKVRIAKPSKAGSDFNDVLLGYDREEPFHVS
jgi:putative DNA primase/helicase